MVLSANAFVIDWNKIVHWAGSGNNKAAMVVQFADNGPEEAYVWGYRWDDGQTPSGEDMFRAIAKESSDLTLFTQFTGTFLETGMRSMIFFGQVETHLPQATHLSTSTVATPSTM